MSGATAGELTVVVRGKEIGLKSLLRAVQTEAKQTDTAARAAAAGIEGKLTVAQQRLARESIASAQSLARFKVASGDAAGAVRILESAERHIIGLSFDQKIKLQTQALQVQAKAARDAAAEADRLARAQAASGKGGNVGGVSEQLAKNLSGSLVGLAGTFGVATIAGAAFSEVINRAEQGFKLSAAIEQTRGSIGVLVGSQQKANGIFAEATGFADKYKFKISEINTALGSMGPLLNESSTATGKQLEVLARLQALRPGATFADAAFSAKELSSLDYTSISEQFNISKGAARGLRDEVAAGADVFQVLDRYLNQNNVTLGVLEQRTQGAAGAINTYEKSQEDLNLALGRFAQGPGKEALNFFTQLTNNATNILSVGQQAGQAGQQAFSGAQGFAEYGQRLNYVNTELSGLRGTFAAAGPGFAALIPSVAGLSEAQFNYAKSLEAGGVATDAAIAKAQGMRGSFEQIGLVQQFAREQAGATEQAIDGVANAMLRAAEVVPGSTQGINDLASAYFRGQLSTEEFRGALDAMVNGYQGAQQATENVRAAEEQRRGEIDEGRAATDAAKAATEANIEALTTHAQQTQASEQQTQLFAGAQKLLAELGGAVANGMATAEAAALRLRAAYGYAYDEALLLIKAQAALGQAKVNAAALSDQRTGERGGGSSTTSTELQFKKDQERKAATRARDESEKQTQADLALARARKDVAGQTAILRDQQRGLNKDSAEYKQIQAQIISLEEGGGSGKKKKGSGSGAAKLSDQQKFNNAQLAQQEKFEDKSEDETQKHYQTELDIQRKYEQKSLEQQRQNEVNKRTSRADFYDQMADLAEQGVDTSAAQAEYEKAFAESQSLSASGKPEEAERLLELRERQIQKDLEYARKIAEIANNEDLTDDQKQAKTANVENRRKLREDANQEELRQLQEGGDALLNERQSQLDEENARFLESQDKVGLAAERAAERREKAYERAGKKIDPELAKARELEGTLNRIAPGAGGGGAAGSSTAATTASTASTSAAGAAGSSPDAILQALAQVANAVVDVRGQVEQLQKAVTDAGRGVEGAVRSASTERPR